jgi:hypothetical protein
VAEALRDPNQADELKHVASLRGARCLLFAVAFASSPLALLSACSARELVSDVTVQDSAGVRIVMSTAPAWAGGSDRWTIDSVPFVEIEGDPNVPEQTLFNASRVELLADGRVIVANDGTGQLLAFDPTGRFIEAWGGPGEGPGEFNGLGGVWRCGADTLVTSERARVSILDSRGAFVRTETVVRRLSPSGAFALEGVSDDCSSILLAVRQARAPSGLEERQSFRYPTEVYWAALDGSSRTMIDSFPGNELLTVNVEGSLVGMRFPFGVQPVWSTDGERVLYGPADRHEVRVFGSGGQLERIVRWSAPREAISEDDWVTYERWRQTSIAEDPVGSLIPTRADHPSTLRPAYSDVLLDDEGNLWALSSYVDPYLTDEEEAAPERWTVLDAEGRWLGELPMPARFALSNVARGLAIGIARDSLDVETVQFLRIRRAP